MSFFDRIKWSILSINNFFSFLFTIKKTLKGKKRTLVVFSHDGSDKGGAPVVLFTLLKNMDLKDYNVVILFKTGGPLVNKCRKQGYHSYIYHYIYSLYLFVLAGKVDSIIINTVICGNVINFLQKQDSYKSVNIIWWIHEGKDMFEVVKRKLPKKLNSNIKIACVSDISKKIFQNFYPHSHVKILHYGILDRYNYIYSKGSPKNNSKFVISVIGMLCDRKNQLQMLDLLKGLPPLVRNSIRVNIISATWDIKYKEQFMYRANGIKQIKFIAGLSHEKILKMYNQTNLLISCSKLDPLPVVVTEAMMMECPCLISSGCGQYRYIQDGVNGYRYNVNDINEMKRKLLYAIKNKNDKRLRQRERETYLRNFSMGQAVAKMTEYINSKEKVNCE